uniref:Replication factor A C-terminal domain-containing protein n=1 Tax=Amphimedon queenslandica TaxID=400682 RepID=A0A1X7T045_AMPQE
MSVNSPENITTKEGKVIRKRDCILRDNNGRCRIVLWESDIQKLTKNGSYKLRNVLVSQYNGVKYVSVSESTIIEPIKDIELISDHKEEAFEEIIQPMIAEGEISAVLNISDYLVCINCNRNVQTVNQTMGSCTKCNATVKLAK